MILKAHVHGRVVHVAVKYQRSSLQWISKYKVTQQISSSSKFILVTQKGIHTKDKFDSIFSVYNNSEILTDWLTSHSMRPQCMPLKRDWPKLLQKASEVCQKWCRDFLFICNQDNSLFNSMKKKYHAYQALTELLKMEIWEVAYTKVTFWKF